MENKDTFFLETFAVWKGCKRPKREPDYTSYDRWGNVSSEYWYNTKGVIRCSNHWSKIIANGGSSNVKAFECKKVSSCAWVLVNPSPKKGYNRKPCGICLWNAFREVR